MLEPNVLHKLEERALDAVTARSQDAASSLSGRFSRMYGASLRHIALLRDVNLRSDRGDPDLESSKELRRAAQELRRSFNRMSFESTSDMSTADLSGLLKRLEERIEASSLSKRGLTPLTRTLADATCVLDLRGSSIPWGDARELVVRLLGAVRDATSRHHHNADDAHQGSAVPPEALRRLEALLPLTTSSAHHATDITTPETPGLPHDRSVPHKFTAAARRSLCGTQLGFIQALESACAQFEKNPCSRALTPITSVIDSWRRGEHGNVGLFSGTNTEPLTRELQRDAALSSHSMVREILRPLIEWSATHYNQLPPTSVDHLTAILTGAVSVMRNAAVTEMLKYPDGVTFEQEGAHTMIGGAHASRTTRKSPAQELLLGKRLGAFNLFGPTITDVSNHFILEPSGVTARELDYLARAAQWARKVSTQTVDATIPIQTSAVWISEFDGGQGTTIPKEIAEQFTELQQKLQVKPDSTKSGFVYPENEVWLHQHVHQHDGFLLVMQEGSLHGALSEQAPRALFVATSIKQIHRHL